MPLAQVCRYKTYELIPDYWAKLKQYEDNHNILVEAVLTSKTSILIKEQHGTKPQGFQPIPLLNTTLALSAAPFTSQTFRLATHLLDSLKSNTQIPRLSETFPTLTLTQSSAYLTAAQILFLRNTHHHEIPVGRKIGFTNRSIWPEYNVDRSNWSYVYDSTVLDISSSSPSTNDATYTIDLSSLSNLEPRIEPELVLGLHPFSHPHSSMSLTDLLACIDWVAPGFEVVISPWKGWKFSALETTAGFALHGRLLIGDRIPVAHLGEGPEEVLKRLEEFGVELLCEGEVVDRGVGANVLGSPIKAFRHLVELVEGDGVNPGLGGGEVITTGTLTRALPIGNRGGGEVWEMKIRGLTGDGKQEDVVGVRCRFEYGG